MGFSSKVKFLFENEWLVGRICEECGDDTFMVVTTGKNGRLWKLKKNVLSLV